MSAVIAAIGRDDIAHYVQTLITVYIVLIFIRIVMAWIPRMPYNRYLDVVLRFVTDVVDPYLRIFRRFVPMIRLGPGALDLSPIVGVLVLSIVGGIVVRLIQGG
jgi:YggT family protein